MKGMKGILNLTPHLNRNPCRNWHPSRFHRQTFRVSEFARTSPTSIDTIPRRSSLPERRRRGFDVLLSTNEGDGLLIDFEIFVIKLGLRHFRRIDRE
jgi:hypothetical protein